MGLRTRGSFSEALECNRTAPMELRHGTCSEVEDKDRLSMFPDDILLSILVRVNITTAVRTSVLSWRWKHLPWLLRDVTMDVKDFLPVPQPKPLEIEHMDEAMSLLTLVTRSFLVSPRSEGAITKLNLNVYQINNYVFEIGTLVSEAIDIGNIKDLNLAILDETKIDDCSEEQMLQQGTVVNELFSAYPSIFHCLTELSLHNVRSANWEIHHHLFECCNKLQNLYLSNCDMGDARLDLICLPKLEVLEWDTWFRPRSPLFFGVVPSLKELYLNGMATKYHEGFVLSEVLSDTASIHNVKVDFQGEKLLISLSSVFFFIPSKLWLQPEGTRFNTAFKKLKKLSLYGIFVEFNLLWTLVLLEAAPLLEMFDIEIWEHPCQINDSRRLLEDERTHPSWQVPEFTGRNNPLMKELQIIGFKQNSKSCYAASSLLGYSSSEI
ncbi:hypothetical protein ACP4OV_028381 [Aristida adscensionis]